VLEEVKDVFHGSPVGRPTSMKVLVDLVDRISNI
jgi:hypothetical protein